MGGYSATLIYNKQRPKKDGTATLYIQVIVNRIVEPIKLDISWPINLINTSKNAITARFPNDKEHEDYTLIISQCFAKISDIFTRARLQDTTLDMPTFLARYNTYNTTIDFIDFFETRLERRWAKRTIKKNTYETHTSSLKALKRFVSKLPFNNLNLDFLNEYKAFMYNSEGYDPDTVRTKLVNMRVYVRIAEREKLIFDYPFKNFQLPKQNRRVEYLNESEFRILKQHFESNTIPESSNRAKCLRAFMFVCYTGLRLGDLYAVQHSNIRNGILKFQPQKDDSGNQKIVEIPLHDYARKLIQTKKGKLFILPSDSVMRQKLSEIAIQLGIDSTMSPHIGRHTFATRFLRHGGRLEVLKELLGHEKIETTMIYVHVDLERKKEEIKLLPS